VPISYKDSARTAHKHSISVVQN